MSPVFKSERHAEAVRQAYAAALAHWPADVRRVTVPTPAGDTHVLVCGREDAPLLVLLHGAQSTAASWQRQAAAWAPHFRIYAIDLIGEAGPSAPARLPLASDAHATWLEAVLDGLGVARAACFGISLGAWLALDFAVRRPARVERLALLCPSGIGRQKHILPWVLPLLLLGPAGRALVRRRIIGPLPVDPAPADRAQFALMHAINRGFRSRFGAIPVFGDEALRQLSQPLFVAVGGRDVMLDSQDTCERLRRLAPSAQVTLLPSERHFIRGQDDAVLAFLRAA
ncbi:alpha/beta fold hydrolase [Achromobacter xylosoxidans]|uniref:alpha/beta fold hydrolase n=1 Tax=Alcaligenes xylosoxydans xylosoxydans TaxID=85698 RepID=UPI002AC9FDBE|nr:alpha/beta fold hydrolase [Achromobacter xylosoxidans]MDZ5613755.1 alpha/beta fold hydrolase [Achromobacter xylosoxidans]MDZ5626983.1 alpha/beta fold hydrolase [Achromobacter xylosoxidans]MDZ5687225.1 alpha/beta fold hydrolase [Achromobacter xylosoxidans]